MTTTLARTQHRPLSLTNAEVAVAAGIAQSKLALVAPLSTFAALADAAGALTNNGSGVLSWTPATIPSPVPVTGGGTGTTTAFTAGSVIFAGPSGVYAQDNANLFWDDTNNRLGLGLTGPLARLHVKNAGEAIFNLSNLSAVSIPDWAITVGSGTQHAHGYFVIGPGTGTPPVATKCLTLISGGEVLVGNSTAARLSIQARTLLFTANTAGVAGTDVPIVDLSANQQGSFANTSGGVHVLRVAMTFAPTSGAGRFCALTLESTVNQTGGATGITRGVYVNVTVTAAADFRALETVVGNVVLGSTSGRVGIGVTAPSALLHLKGGTATADTAPLKFTSGALLTTAEVGAVEFLTDAYYGTITTGAARKQFLFTDGSLAGLTGTLGVANGGTGTATVFTAGSVVFAGASGVYSQDNAKLFWDNTAKRLGIGTASPGAALDVTGDQRLSGGLKVGAVAGVHLEVDSNQIAAWNNVTPSTLYFNFSGGAVNFANGGMLTAGAVVALFGAALADTNGTGVLVLKNATGVPTNNYAGGGQLYVESGALKYRGSSGTVTTLGAA